MPYFEVVLIGLLIPVNALLAMSELAVVSARKSRLSYMAEMGNRGAATRGSRSWTWTDGG